MKATLIHPWLLKLWRWAIFSVLPISGVFTLIGSRVGSAQITPTALPTMAATTIVTGCVSGNNTIALSPGTSDRVMTVNGLRRYYTLRLPPTYDGRSALPVVISLHGFAGSSADQQIWSGWNKIADRESFIMVYPNGTGFPQRWNAGNSGYIRTGIGTQGAPGQVDDVAFFRALLDDLNKIMCVDSARIYVNGLSNGGGMTNRLACQLADRIAAVGMVAGAYSPIPGGCTPSRAIPVIAFHGTADPLVNYYGDPSMNLPPIQQWAADWAKRNGCDSTPQKLPDQGDVSGVHYGNCTLNADVILYTVQGGGHTWPGGQPIPFVGKMTTSISASETMWQFFKAHPFPNLP